MPVAASGTSGAHAAAVHPRFATDPHGESPEHARHQPTDDAEADLLEHQPYRLGVAAAFSRRKRQAR